MNCLSHIYKESDVVDLEPTPPTTYDMNDALQEALTDLAHTNDVTTTANITVPEPAPLQLPVQQTFTLQPVAQVSQQEAVGFRWGDCAEVRRVAALDVESDGVTESPPVSPSPVSKGVEAVKFRTKVCRMWASGQTCQFGEHCAFAHGKHQIRKRSANTPYQVYSNHGTPLPSPKNHSGMKATAATFVPQAHIDAAAVPCVGVPLRSLQQRARVSPKMSAMMDPAEVNFVDTTGCMWFN